MPTLCQKLATAVDARLHLAAGDTGNPWEQIWENRIDAAVYERMPAGSGFDSGTKLDHDASTGEKLVFTTEFHHMNEGGFYDGWTSHKITVRPSLVHGFTLSVSGRNRNDIKPYIAEMFDHALSREFDWPTFKESTI